MKLLDIKHGGKPKTEEIGSRLYKLSAPYFVKLITDEGILQCNMGVGWVTDFRSGSKALDLIIPWKDNDEYNAVVLAHDFFYSGWISQSIADDLLSQGMLLSGSIGAFKAQAVNVTLGLFGSSHYFDIDEPLPEPYTLNRRLEKFRWCV